MDASSEPLFGSPLHLLQPTELHLTIIIVIRDDLYAFLSHGKDRTKFRLDEKALAALRSLKEPCLVMTIVGTQRGGKSTLLNLLHSRSPKPGFGLGHFMDPQTTGLWIWCRKHPRNPNLNIILMDTEGLDSPHIPQWYNWTLAALALLISSYFVYQSKGSIDSSATDRLGVILKVAEQISGSQSKETDQPNFLWLIRDHQLSFKKSPKEDMMGMLDRAERRQLEEYFADSDCFPLPRPVESDNLMKDVETMEWDQLRGEFREEYVVLERQLFQSLSSPRRLGGHTVTGEMIGTLLHSYVEALTEKGILDDLSQLPTQRQMVLRMTADRASQLAQQEYSNQVESLMARLPVSNDELFETHEAAFSRATNRFRHELNLSTSDVVPSEILEYYNAMLNAIAKWQEVVNLKDGKCVAVVKNTEQTQRKCQQVLTSLYSEIALKVMNTETTDNSGYTSIADYDQDIENLTKSYYDSLTFSRSLLEEYLHEFLQSKSRNVNIIARALLKRALLGQLESSIQSFTVKLNRVQEEAQQRIESVLSTLQSELEISNTNISQVNQNLDKLKQNMESELSSSVNSWNQRHEDIQKWTRQILEDMSIRHDRAIEDLRVRETAISSTMERLRADTLEQLKTASDSHTKSHQEFEEVITQRIAGQFDERDSIQRVYTDTVSDKISQIQTMFDSKAASLESSFAENWEQLSGTLSTLKQSSESLFKELSSELSDARTTLNRQVNLVDGILSDLKMDLSSLQSMRLVDLEAQLKSSTASILTSFQESENTSKLQVASIKDAVLSLNVDHSMFKTTLDEVKAQLGALEDSTSGKFDSISHMYSTLKSRLESELAEVVGECDLLKNSQNSSGATLSKLTQSLKDIEAKMDEWDAQRNGFQTEMSNSISTLHESVQLTISEIKNSIPQLIRDERQALDARLNQELQQVRIEDEEKLHNLEIQIISQLNDKMQASANATSLKFNELESELREQATRTPGSDIEELATRIATLESTVPPVNSIGQIETSLKSLQNATSSTFQNMERALNMLQDSISELQQDQSRLNNSIQSIDLDSVSQDSSISLERINSSLHEVSVRIEALESKILHQSELPPPYLQSEEFAKGLPSSLSWSEHLEEELQAQRKALVGAMKSHVSSVEISLKSAFQADIDKLKESIRNLSVAALNPSSTPTSGSSPLVEERLRETLQNVKHIRDSIDALWASVAQLSSKIVNLEAFMDR